MVDIVCGDLPYDANEYEYSFVWVKAPWNLGDLQSLTQAGWTPITYTPLKIAGEVTDVGPVIVTLVRKKQAPQ